MSNCDGNVNEQAGNPESIREFEEILQLVCEFGDGILCDDIAVTEWVQFDFVIAIGQYRRRKARLPAIDFTHVEIEEEISTNIVEKTEEILADSLFNIWLLERGVKNTQ